MLLAKLANTLTANLSIPIPNHETLFKTVKMIMCSLIFPAIFILYENDAF